MTASTPASLEHLVGLYAATDDPWEFRTSAYEEERLRAVAERLPRRRYRAALELGCGNGELARRLARIAGRYAGLDAVPVAIAEARRAVPAGDFHCRFFPCPLPDGPFDLIVLSEFLYFLDADGIAILAGRLAARFPEAEILAVNYCPASGNALDGPEAVGLFARALPLRYRRRVPAETALYRIDRFEPQGRVARAAW